MRYPIYFLFIAIIGASLSSCSESTNVEDFEIFPKYEYFPLEIGKYITYQVDSAIYDTTAAGIVVTNTTSFVRESITDTLRDNSNRLAYKLERAYRPSDTVDWEVTDIWVAVATENQAERVEENLRFIKMTFPLIDGTIWNGNLFIDETTTISVAGEQVELFRNWSYEVDGLDLQEEIGTMNFDSVATLIQADSENLVELRYSVEKYAKNIGLVYREMRIFDTQNISEILPWEEKAQKGFSFTQTVIDHN